MTVLIVSSPKGKGKTTFLCDYARHAREAGKSVGGIASPALLENGKRVGYELLDLRTARRRRLACPVEKGSDHPTVGIYCFDQQAVAHGNAAIVAAVRDGVDVIAIDEIGPLEFAAGGWAPALELALRECASAQELILAIRPSLVDELPTRFASPCWSTARRVTPPWPSLPLA